MPPFFISFMQIKNRKLTSALPYILSFVIPAIIMAASFFSLDIYPGGKTMILTYDLRAQLLAFYGYLSNPGPGYDNLFYSMSGGLGGGFFGTAALYLSPFDLIYTIVPIKSLPTAIYFMVLAKVGLCGLCQSVYLTKNKTVALPAWIVVLVSCCYALMSYNFMYFISPMWYDAVMLLPLIVLCLEKIIEGKKSALFVLLTALCIISNYYMAFMVVIALVLYFIFRVCEDKFDLRTIGKRLILFACHGFISAGISLFVIIPVLMDLNRGKLNESSLVTSGELIKNSFGDILGSLLPQHYAGLGYNASPNIFCGSIITVLAIIWFINIRKHLRSVMAGLSILVFYFLSFVLGPLDRFWHGFREPNNFSVRYAFTFSFFMILFAIRGIKCIDKKKIKLSKDVLKFITCAAVVFTLVELYINGSFIVAKVATESGFTYSEEYYRYCDVYENLIPIDTLNTSDGYGRIITDSGFSSYDGALFGYDGIARFSSSYNYKLSEFFRSLGLASIYQNVKDKGVTPPVSGLLGGRYQVTFMRDCSDLYEPIAEYRGFNLYENTNALPLAFEADKQGDETEAFVENPFENTNRVFRDLFEKQIDISDVFVPVDYSETDAPYIKTIDFNSDATGHYYIFVEYRIDDDTSVPALRDVYLDGNHLGDYGTVQFSHCVDLGVLEEGEHHNIIFNSSGSEVGTVWLYYYDESAYEKIASSVNGFKLNRINSGGIELEGSTLNDSNILVTIPYESGYKVVVDGKRVSYSSYRETLLDIPVSAGEHTIRITYYPPGLKIGIVMSIVSLMVFGLFVIKPSKNR